MATTDLEDVRVEARLNWLLRANAEIASSKENYLSDMERMEADLMRYPIPAREAFAYFGSFLGGIPLFTVILRVLFSSPVADSGKFGLLFLMALVAAAASAVGYFSGKTLGPIVLKIERFRWSTMLPLLPLVGFIWGAIAGAGGGLIAFGVGAVFGIFVGGIVGALAVPFFIVIHRLLRRGDSIELKHFLPVSLGIVMVLCAFVLGM
jgi:hypothetical protein